MGLEGQSILAVVPARSGSKGLPDKNMRELGGRSLIAWAAATLTELPAVDARIISTDSERYAREGVRCGLDAPFLRPDDLADDSADVGDVARHALTRAEEHYGRRFDVLMLVEPTSPLRVADDLERVVRRLITSDAASAAAVSRLNPKWHPRKALVRDGRGRLHPYRAGAAVVRRQELDDLYWRNGVCYAIRRDALFAGGGLIRDGTISEVIEHSVVSIDDDADLAFAEFLLERGWRE